MFTRISKRPFGAAAVCAVALMLAVSDAPAGTSTSGPVPLPLEKLFGGPFELIDHHGQPRSDRDFRGKFVLIYFGYTSCPSICPLNLQHMSGALQLLGENANRVVPIFITVDPKRDTREVLAGYVAAFGPQFIGLTGSNEQIRAAAKAYRVHRRKIIEHGSAPEDYLVDHASITYLLGPDGRFRTLFPHGTAADVMADRISKYIADRPS